MKGSSTVILLHGFLRVIVFAAAWVLIEIALLATLRTVFTLVGTEKYMTFIITHCFI